MSDMTSSPTAVLDDKDVWFMHPKYTGYEANCEGKIRNILTQHEMRAHKGGGYMRVTLFVEGKGKKVLCHRFAYEACVHKHVLSREFDVDHIDNDPLNNIVSNLQKMTKKEHNWKTSAANPGAGAKRAHHFSKPVVATHISSGNTKTFASSHEAARVLGVNQGNVSNCLSGRRKSAGGHTFENVPNDGDNDENLENEEWRDLADAFSERDMGTAKVSNLGRVMTTRGSRTYGTDTHDGYKSVMVQRKIYPVHMLVCAAFCGKRPSPEHTVDHINRVPGDNKATNLRWATWAEQNLNRSKKPKLS